jgi:hypothetical protein
MCTSRKYKGMIIYENDDSDFSANYFSVVNPFMRDKGGRLLHAHTITEGSAKKVVDCLHKLRFKEDVSKYPLPIRNKAMRMLGYDIKSKN